MGKHNQKKIIKKLIAISDMLSNKKPQGHE